MPSSNKLTKTALNKMNKAELVTEAHEAFGVVLDTEEMSKEELIDEILNLQDTPPGAATKDDAGDEDEPTVVVTNDQTGQDPAEQVKGKQMYRIVIDESDDPNASDYCDVSVNGYCRRIKRGKEVTVPEEVVNVLKISVITMFYKDDEGNDKTRDVPRFSWRMIEKL